MSNVMKPGLVFRVFGVGFLFMAGIELQAQTVVITGRITDRKTGEPVAEATVVSTESQGTISDTQGKFELTVAKFPVTLLVSHVSYGLQTLTLDKLSGEVVIRLEPRENKIPEVRVTAGANRHQARMLNRKTRYTIIDYEFEDPYMWFLGCVDNSPRGTRLYLSDVNGDTLCSAPVPSKVSLFRNLFGNIHLVTEDSVFQLFATGDSIRLMYPERKSIFMREMNAFDAAFGKGLVRLYYDARYDFLSLYYVDSIIKKPRKIEFSRLPESNYMERKYAWIGRWFGPGTLNLMINQQKEYYFQKMRSTLVAFPDTLHVINLADNQLHTLGKDLSEIRTIPLTFYFRPSDDITNAYIPFRTITDRVMHRIYVVFHLNSHYTITPLNMETGQLGPELVLPRYSAMDKISIHNDALYYIYPEKVFPYYQRLFKMELR